MLLAAANGETYLHRREVSVTMFLPRESNVASVPVLVDRSIYTHQPFGQDVHAERFSRHRLGQHRRYTGNRPRGPVIDLTGQSSPGVFQDDRWRRGGDAADQRSRTREDKKVLHGATVSLHEHTLNTP